MVFHIHGIVSSYMVYQHQCNENNKSTVFIITAPCASLWPYFRQCHLGGVIACLPKLFKNLWKISGYTIDKILQRLIEVCYLTQDEFNNLLKKKMKACVWPQRQTICQLFALKLIETVWWKLIQKILLHLKMLCGPAVWPHNSVLVWFIFFNSKLHAWLLLYLRSFKC